ncbi:MAG: hypothetical protein PWP57_681, partial [Candidatus Atribacteria bacterium]|nr:hypothetical protein [Candidatus Atribacteria bacterium]
MGEELRFSFSLLVVAAVALAVETLTMRIFSFIFEYHFVSLIISLALLGYGAAGSLYSFLPRWFKEHVPYTLASFLFLFAGGLIFLPLDIYQFWVNYYNWLYFVILLFLTFLPFFAHGVYQLYAFELYPSLFPRFYAANLVGSSLGIVISYLILLGLGELKALIFLAFLSLGGVTKVKRLPLLLLVITGVILFFSPLEIYLSPYAPSRAIREVEENQLVEVYHNPAELLEVFYTPYSRLALGLSSNFLFLPPSSWTLVYDKHEPYLFPIHPDFSLLSHTLYYLPVEILSPQKILIAEGRLGLEGYLASFLKEGKLDWITSSSLFASFLQDYSIYSEPQIISPRKFLAQGESYDLIFLEVPVPQAAVFPGSFSFQEDFLFTTEGMRSILSSLSYGGVAVFSLFLQNPPAVLPKLINIAKESWKEGSKIERHLVIVKNLDFALMMVKKTPWEEKELKRIKEKVGEEHFDFIYYPGIQEEEAEIVFQTQKRYYRIVEDILANKEVNSPFDLRPPRDNRPYFANFFRLSQLPEAWINLGKRWLPFGGSGFWLVVLVLVAVVFLAFFLILFPSRGKKESAPSPVKILKIGGMLTGIGFMAMEISLFLKLEMIVGLPFYTFSLLLLVLLIFSGLGSWRVRRGLKRREIKRLLWLHPLVLFAYFGFLFLLEDRLLSLPVWGSLLVTCIPLAGVAYLCGLP